ncbi:hypothetical protein ACMHYB_41370 [Sorangium sp. So ce1128]
MDLLRQLDTELADLVSRPLGEISRTDLDAILDRYEDVVDAKTRAAMEQLVDDLKQSVSDLEDELARLMDEFGAQADEVADLATQDARDEGWDPDDPWTYPLGDSEVPWVEVPDIAEIEEAFAQIVKTNRVRSYKNLGGAITKFEVDIFEKKAAKFLVDDGRALVGVGDDGVRDVLKIPRESSPGGSEGAAPDFVSISRGHQLIVSEAKGGTIPVRKVRDQLSNALKALKAKGLDGDVARVELIMEQGAEFNPTKFTVKDGYLFDSDEGKAVALDGFNKFPMVIRL